MACPTPTVLLDFPANSALLRSLHARPPPSFLCSAILRSTPSPIILPTAGLQRIYRGAVHRSLFLAFFLARRRGKVLRSRLSRRRFPSRRQGRAWRCTRALVESRSYVQGLHQLVGKVMFHRMHKDWDDNSCLTNFLRIFLIAYIPTYQLKMLPLLPASLVDFYAPGDTIPGFLFNNKTLGYKKLKRHLDEDSRALEDEQYREYKIESHFVNIINHVLENHYGFGMKALILQLFPCPNIDASYLDKWLRIAVKPGIEELALEMSILKKREEYNFPSLLLSNEREGAPYFMCLSSYHNSWLQ